jgi:hypothetical protein
MLEQYSLESTLLGKNKRQHYSYHGIVSIQLSRLFDSKEKNLERDYPLSKLS